MLLRDLVPFRKRFDGEMYGIEIEVEGENLAFETEEWVAKGDGSLGPNGVEYVSREPVTYDNVSRHLEQLDEMFIDRGARFECSVGCSVHVHMNVQDRTINEIYNIITLYYILESMLTEYAGPDRVGNLFCLRLEDAEEPLFELVNAYKDGTFPHYFSDRIRYAALNLTALSRFGTLEFRSFRAIETSPTEVDDWVRLLHDIYQAGRQYSTPSEIVDDFSFLGPQQFLQKVLPNTAQLLRFNEASLFNGMRRAQWLAYDCDWYGGYKPNGPFRVQYDVAVEFDDNNDNGDEF